MEEKEDMNEQDKAKEFYSRYKDLCKEYGYSLVTTPVFVARDDGTFSIVLKTNVNKLSNN